MILDGGPNKWKNSEGFFFVVYIIRQSPLNKVYLDTIVKKIFFLFKNPRRFKLKTIEYTSIKDFCTLGFSLLILVFGFLNLSAQTALVDPDDLNSFSPASYYYDASGELDVAKIKELYESNSFIASDKDSAFIFDKNGNYWYRFALRSNHQNDGQWVLDFQGWSYVDLFVGSPGKEFAEHRTGHLVDYNDRSYPAGNKSYILLDVGSSEELICFARLNAKHNNDIKPSSLEISIMPRHEADRKEIVFKSLVLSFLGIYLIFFLYNIFILFSTKDKAYIYYLLLVIIGFTLTLNYSGYFFEYFSFLKHTYVYHLLSENFIYNGFSIILILFTNKLFQTKERYPKWYRASFYLIGVMILATIAVYLNFDLGMNISMPTFMFFTIAAVTFSIKNIRAGYPSSWYYLIGFGIVFIAGILNIMTTQMGVLPRNILTVSLIIPLGHVIEMLFYSFALANKINVLRSENEDKNQKIISFLEEKKEFQEKVNLELERKVKERTEEIEEQKKIIELEQLKSDKLLLNILPFHTANELKTLGHAKPKSFKNVTILFTDFINFSAITKDMNSEKLVSSLDYCFKGFDDIISNYNLEKIKTIGDSYMCCAGLTGIDGENHALNTINAAKDMLYFVEQWNESQVSKGEAPWKIRIGIHTGPITAGVVGKKKFAYDIWGSAVNLASRLESASKAGRINISLHTHDLVKADIECSERGKIKVKNFGDVEMFFVN